jgi:hypothetical protein
VIVSDEDVEMADGEDKPKKSGRGKRKVDDSDLGGILLAGTDACIVCQKGRTRPWRCWTALGVRKGRCNTCRARGVKCIWDEGEVAAKGKETQGLKRKAEVPEVVIPRKRSRVADQAPEDPIGRAAWHMNNPTRAADLDHQELMVGLHSFFAHDLVFRKNELEYRRLALEELTKIREAVEGLYTVEIFRENGQEYNSEEYVDTNTSSDEVDPGVPEELHDNTSDVAPEEFEELEDPEAGEVEEAVVEDKGEGSSKGKGKVDEESSEDESEEENEEKEDEEKNKEAK